MCLLCESVASIASLITRVLVCAVTVSIVPTFTFDICCEFVDS